MKIIIVRNICISIICCLFSLVSFADVPKSLNGTWLIDAKQTEELLKKLGPPQKNADWIPQIVLRMCVSTMTFSGETLTRSLIGPQPTVESFRLRPQKGEALTYSLETKTGEIKDTIVISFTNEGSISVKSAKMEFMEYGVWKLGKPANPQTGEKDFNQAFQNCALALKNVPFLKMH